MMITRPTKKHKHEQHSLTTSRLNRYRPTRMSSSAFKMPAFGRGGSFGSATVILLIVLAVGVETHAQLRIVSYNTATSGDNDAPVLPRDGIQTVFEAIGEQSSVGVRRPIDVLLLQEQADTAVTTQAMVDLLNNTYGEGVYDRGQLNGGTNGGGRGGLIYNTQTIELVEEVAFGQLSSSAQARQTLRYSLRPAGYGDNATFHAYVNHYKAGISDEDVARRNIEAQAVRANAETLGPDAHIIFAGDFNIRSCTEEMFQTLIGPGNGRAIDPINTAHTNCDWHNNETLRRWHTQSPADGTDATLITGGIDDRFDFQLVTNHLLDGEGLSVIGNSYRTFGNNASHQLNDPVNVEGNTAATATVLDALAQVSDHLPVVVDYQLPAWMHVDIIQVPEFVAQSTPLSLEVQIENIAPAQTVTSADELDYSLSLSASNAEPRQLNGGVLATRSTVVPIELPTMELGLHTFELAVDSDSQGVAGGDFAASGSYTVIAAAVPSWESDTQVQHAEIDLGIIPFGADLVEVPLSIHNLGSEGESNLELQSFTVSNEPEESVFSHDLGGFLPLVPGDQYDFSVFVDPSIAGEFESELTVSVFNQSSVLGLLEHDLTYSFSAEVGYAGDVNGDGRVAFDDFIIVARNFHVENATWDQGDFDRDGTVGFRDFLLLSRNFGTAINAAAVPEPTAAAILLSVIVVLGAIRRCRRRQR